MPGERVGDAVFVRVQVLKLEDHKMEHAISELEGLPGFTCIRFVTNLTPDLRLRQVCPIYYRGLVKPSPV